MKFTHYLSQLFRSHRPRGKKSRLTKRLSRRLFLESLENRRVLATFLVTNTDAFGPGSLWEAVFDAENTPNAGGQPDEVHFDIPNPGVHTIHLNNSLPIIAHPVIIDGYTQSGASPNTLAVGDDAVLEIEIDGSAMPPGANLFNFRGDHSTVRGFAITHVSGICFDLGFGGFFSSNNTIAGNFIGTDASGSDYLADTGYAIQVGHSSLGVQANDNVIGGTDPADRNVITGRGAQMIAMGDAHGTLVQGNYIGVNKNGTAPLQPPVASTAIGIGNGSSNNTIGGTEPGAGNVILGTNIGVGLFQGSTGSNIVQGNFIGTNAAGTAGLGGGIGIQIDHSSIQTIGGSEAGAGNLISGNTTGIAVLFTSGGPTIQGNRIGTDVTGTSAIPNSGDGIFVYGVGGAVIGGTNPGEGNTIAFNGGNGVLVGNGTGASILGNSIYSNFGLGIDLQSVGDSFQVTENDPGDTDTGPNGLQNFPELTDVIGGSSTSVFGTFNSTPNMTFRLEFFANITGDPSGFGEGATYLGFTNVTTDSNGDAGFSATVQGASGVGQKVSATATDPGGSTSEFSACATVTTAENTPPEIFSLDGPTSGFTGESLHYTGDFSDPDPDNWTGTVNFGDGTGDQPLALNPDFTFNFDHAYLTAGTYTVTVSVADNHAGIGTESLTITVTDNTPPVITRFEGPATGLAGDTFLYQVAFGDPDSDTWTATFNWGDGTIDQFAIYPGTNAVLKTYLASGTYTVVVTIADNHGNFDSRSLTTTITDGHPPVITSFNGPATGLVGDTFLYQVAFGDPDPDTWTATFNWGDGTIDQFAIYPGTNAVLKTYLASGTYTVVVTIADNHGNSDSRSLTTTITDGHPPVITSFNGPATGLVGDTFIYQVAFADPDPDTWTATFNWGDGTSDQFAIYPGTNAVLKTYLASGTYTVVVTIADNHGNSDSRSLTTTITDNRPPVAINDTALLNTAASATINVLANDSDPDGDPLTVTAVTQPASGHGTVTINTNGTLTYTQTFFANGTETFTYTISDGHGGTSTATVTVTVKLPARVGIDMLRSQVQHAGLKRGMQLSLDVKLRAAQQALAKGNSRAAAGLMGAFANEVRALKRARLLPASLSDLWLLEDANILVEIGRR